MQEQGRRMSRSMMVGWSSNSYRWWLKDVERLAERPGCPFLPQKTFTSWLAHCGKLSRWPQWVDMGQGPPVVRMPRGLSSESSSVWGPFFSPTSRAVARVKTPDAASGALSRPRGGSADAAGAKGFGALAVRTRREALRRGWKIHRR